MVRPRWINTSALIFLLGLLLLAFFAICLLLHDQTRQARTKIPASAELMDAMAKYADDFRKAGKPVPDSVGLEQLIAEGYTRPNTRSLFPGAEVTLFLNVSENESQQILALARHRDGLWSAIISDGSIQQMTPTKLQEQIRVSGQTNIPGWTNGK